MQGHADRGKVKERRFGGRLNWAKLGKIHGGRRQQIAQRSWPIGNGSRRAPAPRQLADFSRYQAARLLEIDFLAPVERHKHMQHAGEPSLGQLACLMRSWDDRYTLVCAWSRHTSSLLMRRSGFRS